MNLSNVLSTANSSLAAIASQSAVISRNVAGVNDPTYSRKNANVVTIEGGGAQTVSVSRTTDSALFDAMLNATSGSASQDALVNGLNQLDQVATSAQSPATQIGNLTNAIQQYSGNAANTSLAQGVLTSANAVASSLNSAATSVQNIRTQADAGIAASVGNINNLLAQFKTVNTTIVNAAQSGADVTDAMDQRDSILSQLSKEIGITTSSRANNDMVIYTDSGATLFETNARAVTFQPTTSYTATTTGNAVYVDGVPVTGPNSPMPIKSGQLAGLTNLRDNVAVTYQNQLDETARGLINTFAESDQSNPPTLPTVPGLFTYSGAPSMPGIAITPGLAANLTVNPNVDPNQGGNLSLLRDGGISNPSNPAYNYNTTGGNAFTGRLQDLLRKLSQTQSFDPTAGAGAQNTLSGYASASISWLEGTRQAATDQGNFNKTVLSQASQALSNATGVNLDEEMSNMLDLEHSYAASSKLITAVDNMYTSLFQVT
jgi:flagellar hook-associated protein 1 FlgK